jgi:hypothetical protein
MTVFAITTQFLRRYDKTETYLGHAGLDPASRKKEHWIAQSSWAMTASLGWFNLAG